MATVGTTPEVKPRKITLDVAEGFEAIIVKMLDEKQTRNVVTLAENELAVILPEETLGFADKAFSMQTDYENASKFIRAFAYEAFKSRLAYIANAAIAQWEREIAKHSKKYPKLNREQCIAELCEARSYKEMFSRATAAAAVKDVL